MSRGLSLSQTHTQTRTPFNDAVQQNELSCYNLPVLLIYSWIGSLRGLGGDHRHRDKFLKTSSPGQAVSGFIEIQQWEKDVGWEMSCLAWSTQFGRNLFKSVLSDVTVDWAVCKKLKKVFQLLEGWVRITIKHFLTQLFSTCSTLILKHLSAVLSKSKVFVLKSVRVWWS